MVFLKSVLGLMIDFGNKILLALTVFFLSVSAPVISAEENSSCVSEEYMVGCFLEFHQESQRSLRRVAKYFSKRITDNWLGLLFEAQSRGEVMESLNRVSSLASSGKEICYIYDLYYESVSGGSGNLTVLYEMCGEQRPQIVILNYEKYSGIWLIDSETHKLTVADADLCWVTPKKEPKLCAGSAELKSHR